jgi:hypothetical protein
MRPGTNCRTSAPPSPARRRPPPPFVDGRHWIGERLWRPVGTYSWDLTRIDGDWKVTRMEFAMTEEIGDRALATEAMERARTLTP